MFGLGLGIGYLAWGGDNEEDDIDVGLIDDDNGETTPTPTMTNTPTPTPSNGDTQPTQIEAGDGTEEIELQVYFPKNPESNDDFTYTEGVSRESARVDIGEFAIEQLIQGPSQQAQNQGLFSPIELEGESNCDGQDFTLRVTDNGEAILQFCRQLEIAGVGDTARIQSAVDRTLQQFSTVDTVTILTRDGSELGDLSS